MKINEFKAKWPEFDLHIHTLEGGSIAVSAICGEVTVSVESKQSLKWVLRGIDAALSTAELEKPPIGPIPDRISGKTGDEFDFDGADKYDQMPGLESGRASDMGGPPTEAAKGTYADAVQEFLAEEEKPDAGPVDLTEQPMEFRTFHKRTKHKAVQIDIDFSIQVAYGVAYGNAGDWLCENEAGGARWIVLKADFERRYIEVGDD